MNQLRPEVFKYPPDYLWAPKIYTNKTTRRSPATDILQRTTGEVIKAQNIVPRPDQLA